MEELEMKNQDHSDHNTVKISENTLKSPGELRRPSVTQTLGKKPPVKTCMKNSQEIKYKLQNSNS